MTQKFFKGDLVYINKLPKHSSHFRQECNAIVIASYAEQFNHSPQATNEFTLYVLSDLYPSECSWYNEENLTLIQPDRFDLLPTNHLARINYEAKKARTV